jgi:hypothetical protein
MESWVSGAIMILVGALVIACSGRQTEWNFYMWMSGLATIGIGSWIFVAKFKRWISGLMH